MSGAGLDVGHIKTRPNHPLAFLGSSWEPQQKKFPVCVCVCAHSRACACVSNPTLAPHTLPRGGHPYLCRQVKPRWLGSLARPQPPQPQMPGAQSRPGAGTDDPTCPAFPSLFFPCGQMKESAAVLPTIAGCLYGPHCRLAPALWPCELVHCSPPGRVYGWMSYSPWRKEPYSRASIIGEAFRLGLRALRPPLHPFRFEKAWERGGVMRSTSPRRFH